MAKSKRGPYAGQYFNLRTGERAIIVAEAGNHTGRWKVRIVSGRGSGSSWSSRKSRWNSWGWAVNEPSEEAVAMATLINEGRTPAEAWSALRALVGRAAEMDGNWAGAPTPVHGIPLNVEPRYPYRGLQGFHFGEDIRIREPADDGVPEVVVANRWFSAHRNGWAHACHDAGSDRHYAIVLPEGSGRRLEMLLRTVGVASQAWDAEAELAALDRLKGLVTETSWRTYVLSGCFFKTSPRSGVMYVFRKGRPTIALRDDKGNLRVLACLCLHPIGHYDETWAGSMVPTDDVIAHYMLMMADEHKYWAKANHHEPEWATSGI